MKKYFTLMALMLIGGFLITSCTRTEYVDDGIDYDTYSVVYDATGTFAASNGYNLAFDFPQVLYPSDVVLVYRRAGTFNGNTVWQPLPRTVYLNNGNGDEFDYDFDFTVNDVQIYVDATDINAVPAADYLNNQTFRIVIVPASFGGKVDLSSYEKVIKHYNIDDTKVKNL